MNLLIFSSWPASVWGISWLAAWVGAALSLVWVAGGLECARLQAAPSDSCGCLSMTGCGGEGRGVCGEGGGLDEDVKGRLDRHGGGRVLVGVATDYVVMLLNRTQWSTSLDGDGGRAM